MSALKLAEAQRDAPAAAIHRLREPSWPVRPGRLRSGPEPAGGPARSLGNRETLRLLEQRDGPQAAPAVPSSDPLVAAHASGAPRESLAVADRVMRTPAGPSCSPTSGSAGLRGSSGRAAPLAEAWVGRPGQPLDPETRAFMEPRFGRDFSHVRVHLGPAAEQSAGGVGARAFVLGRDIVFGAGQYEPHSPHGARLLAHELAHVVQDEHTAGPPATLHRYEGPEHQDLGDAHVERLLAFLRTDEGRRWARDHEIDSRQLQRQAAENQAHQGKGIQVRPDLRLTPGQIIALMGDFYATWEALQRAPKSEVEAILAVMEKERRGTATNANAEYETITKGRYTQLARKNAPHFAPRNKEAWRVVHLSAVVLARRSRQAGPTAGHALYQEAMGMDAAAGHFLTDAFASGHLMDSTKVQAAIQNHLLAHPVPVANPEMRTVVAGVQSAGLAVPLALKNIHDAMNAEGFEVANRAGMAWRTYGDDHLKNAVETQHVAALAVLTSRLQIDHARDGAQPDPDEVLRLLPDEVTVDRATTEAIRRIPRAVAEITPLISRSIGMLDTVRPPWYAGGPVLPFVAKSLIGTISDPGRPQVLEDHERRKQNDPTTPYPTPPMLRWDF